MSKTQRLFRYVWRVNAVLILVATAGVSFAVVTLMWSEFGGSAARSRVFEAAPPLGGSDSGERLFLGQVALIRGTSVLRGELVAHRSGAGISSSSGGYSETRNILFVDNESGIARWLLPDDDHIITEHPDVVTEGWKISTDVNYVDGSWMHRYGIFTFDGIAAPVGPDLFTTWAFTRIDDHTYDLVEKLRGRLISITRTAISADGTTRTSTTVGTNEQGRTVQNVAIYERWQASIAARSGWRVQPLVELWSRRGSARPLGDRVLEKPVRMWVNSS